jgi:hypothetical protein
MTRDDIIRMAREVGIVFANHTAVGSEENLLQNFAALVAAAEREKCYEFIEILIDAEREACAKVAENGMLGITIAKAIRARGKE